MTTIRDAIIGLLEAARSAASGKTRILFEIKYVYIEKLLGPIYWSPQADRSVELGNRPAADVVTEADLKYSSATWSFLWQ